MASKRTIITLPEEDKIWLEGYSRTRNISMAEATRQGIHKLKESMQPMLTDMCSSLETG